MPRAAIAQDQDYYPTRISRRRNLLSRHEPVVYGAPEDGPLSRQELEAFDRDGFLIYPNLFDGDDIADCIDELARLARDPQIRSGGGVITEPGTREVRSIFAIHRRSTHFARLARDSRILHRARQLLGGDTYIHQSRINYKPGFKGKGFNWHSDFETWHAEDGMPAMRAVSCSIILTDNDEFNGPLMLIPGSHRHFVPCVGETPEAHYNHSLQSQQAGIPDEDSLSQLIEEAGGIRSFKGPAGSVLFFDCNTLHGSNANLSPNPRSNVFFVYNSMENCMQEPYAAAAPRPAFLADPDPQPL